MSRQQLATRHLTLHQHQLLQAGLQRINRRFHLRARGEQDQGAVGDLAQICQQLAHHFAGVGLGVLGIGGSLDHEQPALGAVVEGAVDFQSGCLRVVQQTSLLQEIVKAAATGQRGRGNDGTAHLAPQRVAQQVAGHDGAGVRGQEDQPRTGVGLEPLGQGLGAVRQQQAAGVHHAGQSGRELPQPGV